MIRCRDDQLTVAVSLVRLEPAGRTAEATDSRNVGLTRRGCRVRPPRTSAARPAGVRAPSRDLSGTDRGEKMGRT